MTEWTRRFSLAAIFAVLACPAFAQVGADLNISPKRVVFAPGERSATVYVFNQGDQPATYTVELVDRVMQQDGAIVALADHPQAGVSSAKDLVQHTPRRITLQPRESQAIRLRARPAGDGAAEHRSHLTVTALPPETSGLTAEQALRGSENGVALQAIALFSISIPVIVREAQPDARAEIRNLALERTPEGQFLTFDLARLGPNSVYGDLEVQLGEAAEAPIVTAVRGVSVYPEIPSRRLRMAVPGTIAAGQVITVTYRDDDARPGQVLTKARLSAP